MTSAQPSTLTGAPLTGTLFVLVGPAGVGKNTLMQAVIERGLARQLPTATTRAIRANETEGVQHFFVTADRFRQMIAGDELLEYQQVHDSDRYYGIVRQPLQTALEQGESLIADIEILGAQIVRAAFPANVVTIFITLDRLCNLKNRMELRREAPAEIARRLLRAPLELAYMPDCDYVIVNDDPDQAAAELIAVIRAAREGVIAPMSRPAPFTLRYEVELTVTCGPDRLTPLGQSYTLRTAFTPPQFPNSTGQTVLAAALNVPPSALALLGGEALAHDGFLPPVELACFYEDGIDGVRYRYAVHLNERIPAPLGWAWQPLSEAQPVVTPAQAALA